MLTDRWNQRGSRPDRPSLLSRFRAINARCTRPALRLSRDDVLRDDRGSVVTEFAMVAPPFILLMMGIIELSVMFFTSSVIEGATKEAARTIRTGQVQSEADPVAAFQSQLCDALFNVIDCTQVIYNVQTFGSFNAVNMPIEVNEDGEIINNGFSPGGSGAVTVVRAIYRWEYTTPLIGDLITAGLAGNLIVSTVAFQNEPYNVE